MRIRNRVEHRYVSIRGLDSHLTGEIESGVNRNVQAPAKAPLELAVIVSGNVIIKNVRYLPVNVVVVGEISG